MKVFQTQQKTNFKVQLLEYSAVSLDSNVTW